MLPVLDFEKGVAELEERLRGLRRRERAGDPAVAHDIGRLEARLERMLQHAYRRLGPWQKVQVARHPGRPHAPDFIGALIDDFLPLAGDRMAGDDPAIVGGIGRFRGYSAVVLGHDRGADDVRSRDPGRSGPRPAAYRKAQRLMRLADAFGLVVITLVDTPGVEPEGDAGIGEAVSGTISAAFSLKTPIVSVITGEGFSAAALALAVGDRLFMLEHAVFAAVAPEAAARALWRDDAQARAAAEALCIASQDLREQGIVDAVIPEPVGGAHRHKEAAAAAVGDAIEGAIRDLVDVPGSVLCRRRRDRWVGICAGAD